MLGKLARVPDARFFRRAGVPIWGLGLFLGLGLPPGTAAAQSQPEPTKPRRASVAYFGENVVNPGASIGYEAAFLYRKPHELFGGAHIGGYNSTDPSYYALFLYFEGGYRLNFAIGFFLEARIGLGYTNVSSTSGGQTLPDGTTVPTVNASANYLMPIGLAGVGWDLYPRTGVPLSFFADAGGMGRYNQAEPFGGGPVLTAGLAYQFGTGRPVRAELPAPSPPPPVAPTVGDASELPPGVTPPQYTPPPAAPTAPAGPAEPAPRAQDQPVVPPPAHKPAAPPPSLPPPPTVPARP
jgi:hypothetical protein